MSDIAEHPVVLLETGPRVTPLSETFDVESEEYITLRKRIERLLNVMSHMQGGSGRMPSISIIIGAVHVNAVNADEIFETARVADASLKDIDHALKPIELNMQNKEFAYKVLSLRSKNANALHDICKQRDIQVSSEIAATNSLILAFILDQSPKTRNKLIYMVERKTSESRNGKNR